MSSGTRGRVVATSAEVQARYEAAEIDQLRAQLARGEISMRDAQLQLVEMVLHRTANLPESVQAELRRRLLETVDTDPYFQLALEVSGAK